jgi:hypothetical protein
MDTGNRTRKAPRPGTYGARLLEFIEAHPGCTFTECYEHLFPDHDRVFSAASGPRDRLVFAGLVRTERDGRCVRHYINP